MKIEKTAIQTQKGRYKTVYKTSGTISKEPKVKSRYEIEKNVVPNEDYDLYDIVGDLANCTNDILSQLSNNIKQTPAIKKYKERQLLISKILNSQNNKK